MTGSFARRYAARRTTADSSPARVAGDLERPGLQLVQERYDRIHRTGGLPALNAGRDERESRYVSHRVAWQSGDAWTNTVPHACNPLKGNNYRCQNPEFCAHCWMSRSFKGGLDALMRHYPSDRCMAFSTSLPAIRRDPGAVLKARKALLDALASHGWHNHTVFVHVFGDNPAEGVKAHLDGIVSGGTRASWPATRVNDRHGWTWTGSVADAMGAWSQHEPYLEARFVDEDRGPGRVARLVGKGKYAGRCTVPTPRFIAGRYGGPGRRSWRLTNVSRTPKDKAKAKLHRVEDIEDKAVPGRIIGDYTYDDMSLMYSAAASWRRALKGRVRHSFIPSLNKADTAAVIDATRWRSKYGLGTDDDLRVRLT